MRRAKPSPVPGAPAPQSSILSHLKVWALGLAVSLIALIPWWRNHSFLQDFYDYGLFINANQRLAEGQRPFLDFTTPAQSAAFLLNSAAEKIGGGTYVGMTRGAAVLIALGGLGLTLMLARRFNPFAAALLALAITVGSASQHTIIFYNPLGVIAAALTVWSFAVAPLLRRETVGWHLLAAAGLFLGGTNKINFHLLACAMALGWVLYAWVAQKAGSGRALLTVAFMGAFGFIVPIAFEIAWTGAGWTGWFYNVVQLPLSARGDRISYLFSPKLYLTTLHDYYGPLWVPQVGLIGVLMPLFAAVAAWRKTAARGRHWHLVFLILAGFLAAFASSALLLTNNEISYVTFAAALVIAVGLWLGFDLKPQGGWFAAGVLLPALILTLAGGNSAWRGQRSQFGHVQDPRHTYELGEQSGADFHYLRGLHIPSGLARSLAELSAWRRKLPNGESAKIFYGPGTEWLEHIWPVNTVKGVPLIVAAFDGQRENDLLKREVISGTTFHYLLALEAWDDWSAALQDELHEKTTEQRLCGPFLLYRKLPPGTVSGLPLEFMFKGFGGNVDSMRMISGLPMQTLPDKRLFLGTDQGTGQVEVGTPCHRMSAEYVVERRARGTPGAYTVDFSVSAKMDAALLLRWHGDIILPDGVDELVVPIEKVDGSGLPLAFTVSIPPGSAGKVLAGWRAFELSDTAAQAELPPTLRTSNADLLPAKGEAREILAPASMKDATIYLRNVRIQDGAVTMSYRGEIWLQVQSLYTDIKISVRLAEDQSTTLPKMLFVYYKGGRLEPFAPAWDAANRTMRFTGWTPERGGWIGILSDQPPDSPSLLVKIDAATRH